MAWVLLISSLADLMPKFCVWILMDRCHAYTEYLRSELNFMLSLISGTFYIHCMFSYTVCFHILYENNLNYWSSTSHLMANAIQIICECRLGFSSFIINKFLQKERVSHWLCLFMMTSATSFKLVKVSFIFGPVHLTSFSLITLITPN